MRQRTRAAVASEWIRPALVAAALVAAPGPSDGRAAAAADPAQAHYQLCQARYKTVEALYNDLHADRRAYDGRQQSLAQLDADLAKLRAGMDPSDQAARDRYQIMVDKHEAIVREMTGTLRPAYTAAAAKFAEAKSGYDRECGRGSKAAD